MKCDLRSIINKCTVRSYQWPFPCILSANIGIPSWVVHLMVLVTTICTLQLLDDAYNASHLHDTLKRQSEALDIEVSLTAFKWYIEQSGYYTQLFCSWETLSPNLVGICHCYVSCLDKLNVSTFAVIYRRDVMSVAPCRLNCGVRVIIWF